MNTLIRIRAIGLFCCLLLTHWAFSQTTRYVSTTGITPAASATSWATSTTDLQGAINASQPGDQVWVAQGTYRPASGSSFSMLPGVAIYGGFRGTETSLSERLSVNPVTTEGRPGHPSNTTLAGNGSRVINNPASLSLTRSAVLDGFVITGGGSVDLGGGMYNNGSSPTLTNCSFQGNQATGGSVNYGGAMYNDNSSPTLTNCLFQGNQATGGFVNYGGAMANLGSSNPVLTNCLFQNNQATGSFGNYGGAMYNDSSNPGLTNCSFQGNQTTGGSDTFNVGGAMYNGNSSPTLTNCSFQGNLATGGSFNQGGAMFNNNSNPTLTNTVVWNNGRENTFYNISNSSLTARYSLFDNTSGVDITGPGNLTTATSPFVSATSVALAACSPAINAGNPASATAASGPYSATALPATDLTGNVRISNGRIDMGAVEYQQQNGVPLLIVQQPVAGSIVCAGTTVVMSVSLTGNAPAYQWYRSGTALTGIASATTASLTLTNTQLTDIGSYSVIISGDCPSVTSTAFSLSVNALPSVTVTAAPSTTLSCTNPSLTLTAQTSATAFAWSSAGSTGQTLPVSQTGTYSVTVTDGNGCTAVSNSQTIARDNTSPTVSVSAISNQLTCTQPQLTLTATASVTALRWSTGQTTTTISVSTAGTYSVTATGANGCTVVSNNLPITENFSLPPFTIASATVCPGQTINLTASGCGGQILWSTGATTAMITLTAGSSTSLLTATCTLGVCSTTASGQVVVGGIQPPPAQILSFTADEAACPVRLTGRGVASSFTMTGPKDYVFSTVYREGATHEAIGLNVKQAGTYTLTATYTNSCGTSAPVTRTVTVGRNCP